MIENTPAFLLPQKTETWPNLEHKVSHIVSSARFPVYCNDGSEPKMEPWGAQ